MRRPPYTPYCVCNPAGAQRGIDFPAHARAWDGDAAREARYGQVLPRLRSIIPGGWGATAPALYSSRGMRREQHGSHGSARGGRAHIARRRADLLVVRPVMTERDRDRRLRVADWQRRSYQLGRPRAGTGAATETIIHPAREALRIMFGAKALGAIARNAARRAVLPTHLQTDRLSLTISLSAPPRSLRNRFCGVAGKLVPLSSPLP